MACFYGSYRFLLLYPEFQNQGIGTKLLEEIENAFEYVARYELFTGHKSRKNLHLYKKNGYKIFKRQKLTDDLTIVFMEKCRN